VLFRSRCFMVGDGINDGPVLAAADVSCAMGQGSAVAQSAADLLLLHESLESLSLAVRTARQTLRVIRQNLAWAVGYNSLALPIAAGAFEPLGFILRPEVGAISMAGSSIIVALNAVALKRLRLPAKPDGEQHPPKSEAPRAETGPAAVREAA